VEAELIAAARRSQAPEDDLGPDAARSEGYLDDRPYPEAVDLREPWHDVGNQGHTTSCVGWALADSVLRWHHVKAGRLAPEEHLSPRYVWMASKEFDQRIAYPSTFLEKDGTSLKAGLEVVRRFGIVLEDELPWRRRLATGSPDEVNASAQSRRLARYFNLGDDSVDRRGCFDDWRRWMHQRGPVLVLLGMDSHLGRPGELLDDYDAASVESSHAAALLGYDRDSFLLRSSWGASWGQDGYARMSLDYAAQAIIESYGVVI
jgi:Papain family cysteine protease